MAHVYAAVAASLSSGGVESLGWLNDLLGQFWPTASIAIGALTKETVEPMLAEVLPGPLSTLRFTKIDLGSIPPTFDRIDVHTRHEGFMRLNLDIAWEGECDIELKADGLPALGVRYVRLRGRLSVVLGPLVERLPVVSAVQLAFINPPELSLDFTGLANVADFAGVDKAVRKTIDGVLRDLMVLPRKMFLKLDPAKGCIDAHHDPLGVCRITVVRAGGFKVQGRMLGKDVPDVYIKVKFGANPAWKTEVKRNSTSPKFDESRDFLLSDHDQIVFVEAFDDDVGSLVGSADDYLGSGAVSVGELLLADGRTVDVPLANAKKGKHYVERCSVTLKCDAFPLATDLASLDLDLNLCGLLSVIVAKAYGVPGEKKDAAPYVTVAFGRKVNRTVTVLDAPGIDVLNPTYDATFLMPLDYDAAAAIAETPVVLTLMNGKDEVGAATVDYAQLLEAQDLTVKTKAEVGRGAFIEFLVSLRGVCHSP